MQWVKALAVVVCCAPRLGIAAPYTVETLTPYLHNEVNALELNHLYIQSMFAMDATPITVGAAVRAAPASFQLANGKVANAGLGKTQYVLALGFGNPDTSFAVFGGVNISSVRPSGFPNIMALSGDESNLVRAHGNSAVVFGGLAYAGWAVEAALFRTELGYDADSNGRFMPGGCHLEYGCTNRGVREGAPLPELPESVSNNDNKFMLNFEHHDGHAVGLLLGRGKDAKGRLKDARELSALRLIVNAEKLLPTDLTALSLLFNRYAPEVDYWGDYAVRVRDAQERNEALPNQPQESMYETSINVGRLLRTPLLVKATVQAWPKPLFRAVELGWSTQGNVEWGDTRIFPQVGFRAKMFQRASTFVPGMDSYAGATLAWLGDEDARRGVSMYVSYSYNSPDSLTFLPVADAHALGLQLVWGNPLALPTPVPIMRYPNLRTGEYDQEDEEQSVLDVLASLVGLGPSVSGEEDGE